MERIETKSDIKSGLARFRKSNGKITVTYKEDNTVFEFDVSDCPSFCKTIPNGVYRISAKADGIIGMNPWSGGPYSHKVLRILPSKSGDKDDPPGFTEKEGKYGPYRNWRVVFEITKGDYKGMTAVKSYIDKFGDKNGFLGVIGTGDAAGDVWNLLELTGIMDQKIPYDDKILIHLQRRMLKAAKEFDGMYADGFLKYLSESMTDEEDNEDWDNPNEVKLNEEILDDDPDEDWDDEEEEKDDPPF